MLKIAYSPVYKYKLPEGHRFPMIKYELIPQQLLREGIVEDANFFHPEKLSDKLISLTHTQEFLNKLNRLELSRREIRDIGFPVKKELIERGKHIVNGTLQCAYHAMKNGVSLNVAGGTHHSYRDRGEGFCVFNDMAVASNVLLHRKEVNSILIVDLDVHQGNGTAHIFEDDNRVFTFSMHGDRNYPLKKERSDLDIGLPDGTKDEKYLDILKKTLPKLIEEQKPDLIFYLAGVDILESDKLGRLKISMEGCYERDRFVFQTCKDASFPVAVSMGGGYSERVADIVEAHCNTFKLAKEVFDL